jgi:hypothetical protein
MKDERRAMAKMKKKAESREQRTEGVSQKPVTYEVGAWAGMPQWRCLLCGFDTLDENAMFEHIETHKLGAPPPSTSLKSTGTMKAASPQTDPQSAGAGEHGNLGEGKDEVFEVELEEVSSTVDEQGNEHKTFTVKE